MGKVLNFKNKAVQEELEMNGLDARFTTQLVVEIENYKFELDEEFPWINVFKNINDSTYEFVDDIDILNRDYTCSVNTIEELKEVSVQWYVSNIKTNNRK